MHYLLPAVLFVFFYGRYCVSYICIFVSTRQLSFGKVLFSIVFVCLSPLHYVLRRKESLYRVLTQPTPLVQASSPGSSVPSPSPYSQLTPYCTDPPDMFKLVNMDLTVQASNLPVDTFKLVHQEDRLFLSFYVYQRFSD